MDIDLLQRLKAAEDPSTSPDRLAELAKDAFCLVRSRVAEHPSTPEVWLERLKTDHDRDVRRAAKSAIKIRRLCSQQETNTDFCRRLKEASDPNTSPERLTQLASDLNPLVRWCVSWHPSVPQAALASLGVELEEFVRLWVDAATHRRTKPVDVR